MTQIKRLGFLDDTSSKPGLFCLTTFGLHFGDASKGPEKHPEPRHSHLGLAPTPNLVSSGLDWIRR